MTREEIRLQVAISVIQGVLEAKHGVIGEVVPSVAVAIALRIADAFVEEWYRETKEQEQPESPSNLDEAAENSWAVYEYRESPRGLYSTCYLDGFKDGAEWMAVQGVTLNISIDELGCGAYNACVEQGLTSKDDVIVQIRKK